MKLVNIINILILSICIFSCSTKKNVVYMQDMDLEIDYNFPLNEHIISSRDILKISLKTQNPENLLSLEKGAQTTSFNQTRESLIFSVGIKVDNAGFIDYPELGKIKASGLKTTQLSEVISSMLTTSDVLIEPIVEVKVLNLNFTVIGEVNRPGNYFFDSEINLLQALGMAGDLTITGKRDDVKLIRIKNDEKKVLSVDLTKSNFLVSESFQIYSGDVIIVNPNTNRVKNAGIIGNSGTLLSLLSFILSTIIITRS